MDEVEDSNLEEIEARLYSLIHYNTVEDEPAPTLINNECSITQLISDNNIIQLNSVSTMNNDGDVHQSVHQSDQNETFALLKIRNRFRYFAGKNAEKELTNYQPNNLNNVNLKLDGVTSAQKKQSRNARRNAQRRLKKLEKQKIKNQKRDMAKQLAQITIYVSDDEDDDVSSKKNNDKDIDDDEIIYIPPPPVEVIDIEDDSPAEIPIQIEFNTKRDESNDFLENSNLETNMNFNFSLHGSDFNLTENNSSIKHTEYCETESSSSTTEHRNFNDSVKTIVFNEVEFPKGDIFSEKNLDTFGSMITPKRSSNITPNTKPPEREIMLKSQGNYNESCNSSSESDYESTGNKCDKSLPDLSVMVEKDSFLMDENGTANAELEIQSQTPLKKKKKIKSKNKTVSNENSIQDNNDRKRTSSGGESVGKRKKMSQEENVQNEITSSQIDLPPELIVVDEDNGDTLVIESSDEDHDMRNLNQVGKDLTLANFNLNADSSKEKNNELSLSTFDVKQIQSTQSDDPEKWKILDADKFIGMSPRKVGPRCKRCRHFGHFTLNCPDKPGPPPCTLCGEPNHRDFRCPQKQCRQCGSVGDYSTSYCWHCFRFRYIACNLCNMKGHVPSSCPDLWRRYHLTSRDSNSSKTWRATFPGSSTPSTNPLNHKRTPHQSYRNWVPVKLVENVVLDVPIKSSNGHEVQKQRITIDSGPIVLPKGPILKPRNQQWCCGCAQNGHLEHECNYFNREFPPTLPSIISYQDVGPEKRDAGPSNVVMVEPGTDNDRIVVSIPNTSNLNIQINRGMHKSSKLSQPKTKAVENIECNHDIMSDIIMNKSFDVVQIYLKNEITVLQGEVKTYTPRAIRDKLFKFDGTNTAKTKNLKCFWMRNINMYLFGVHKLYMGKLNVNYLNKTLAMSKSTPFPMAKRRALLSAYTYVFGCKKHKNVNYYKLVKMLISKFDGKIS